MRPQNRILTTPWYNPKGVHDYLLNMLSDRQHARTVGVLNTNGEYVQLIPNLSYQPDYNRARYYLEALKRHSLKADLEAEGASAKGGPA